jgi:hypothetical protein
MNGFEMNELIHGEAIKVRHKKNNWYQLIYYLKDKYLINTK